MSFPDSVWRFVDQVQSHAQQRRKAVEELIQLFSERAMYENCYAQGLTNLSCHSYTVTSHGGLNRAVVAMKLYCGKKAEAVRKFSSALEEQLVEPLRNMLVTQRAEAKLTASQVKSCSKQLKNHRKALQEAKEKYVEGFRQAEEMVKKAEGLKSASEKKKLWGGKTDGVNGGLKSVLMSYKEALAAYNAYIPEFTRNTEEALRKYQAQEEERVSRMIDAFQTLATLTAHLETRLADVTATAPSPQLILEDELQPIAMDSEEPSSTPIQVFEAYQGSHWGFTDLGETAPELQWTGSDLLIRHRSGSDFDEVRQRIDSIMFNAWKGEVTEQELAEFRVIVHEARGRKQWVSYMNTQRAAGKFKMPAGGFEAVARTMNIVLDECEASNDITTGKNCIILSQTFHHFQEMEKVFLQAKIVSHSLWRGEEIWNTIIKDGIDNEFKKQKECRAHSEDSAEIRNVVFGQLSTFAHVMALFEVDSLVARKVLTDQCQTYSISPEEGEILLTIFADESPTEEPPHGIDIPHSRSLELIDLLEEEKTEDLRRRQSTVARG